MEIYDKTHAVTEVAKAQDLQGELESWRPRGPKVGSILKAGSLETQGERAVQCEPMGRKTSMSQFEHGQAAGIPAGGNAHGGISLFVLFRLLTGWSKPTHALGRATGFTQSIDLNVNLI